jgi:hypothetical protein
MSSPSPSLFVAGIPAAEHTQMGDGAVSSSWTKVFARRLHYLYNRGVDTLGASRGGLMLYWQSHGQRNLARMAWLSSRAVLEVGRLQRTHCSDDATSGVCSWAALTNGLSGARTSIAKTRARTDMTAPTIDIVIKSSPHMRNFLCIARSPALRAEPCLNLRLQTNESLT